MVHRLSGYQQFNLKLSENLRKCSIIPRPGAGNGVYLSALLPTLMWISYFRRDVSSLYLSATILSVALLINSIIFVINLSNGSISEKKYYLSSIICGCIGVLIHFIIRHGQLLPILCCIPVTMLYSVGVRIALYKLPRCFTLGEAMLTVQALVLFVYSAILKIYDSYYLVPRTDHEICYYVAQTGLLTVIFIVAQSYRTSNNLTLFLFVTASSVTFLFVFLHIMLGKSSILWLLIFITENKRPLLISSWLLFVILAVIAIRHQTSSGQKASTSTRKVFHMLAVAVYLPGILIDTDLMVIASAIALSALLIVEMLRKTEVLPFSDFLNQAFAIYCDEKDIGGVSLTPLYLLAGVSCPLFFHSDSDSKLPLLSGVLSIGIGDSAASWYGSRYGRIKWSGSNRTIEGTIFNIVSQIAIVYLLCTFGLLEGESLLLKGTIAACVSGITEAFIDQVDNLVLPIVTLITLSLL